MQLGRTDAQSDVYTELANAIPDFEERLTRLYRSEPAQREKAVQRLLARAETTAVERQRNKWREISNENWLPTERLEYLAKYWVSEVPSEGLGGAVGLNDNDHRSPVCLLFDMDDCLAVLQPDGNVVLRKNIGKFFVKLAERKRRQEFKVGIFTAGVTWVRILPVLEEDFQDSQAASCCRMSRIALEFPIDFVVDAYTGPANRHFYLDGLKTKKNADALLGSNCRYVFLDDTEGHFIHKMQHPDPRTVKELHVDRMTADDNTPFDFEDVFKGSAI
eukprot:gnl/TRDRNA2_/TRDRNA2_174462_c0_seq1.p1 gnl/TRDRNA2_/TRDRNA2_174462_c0~~gnl/TRDRNA2_/TRDRNA2_174462_c0_seq1.p1  ORF type:complete len:275 (-),score=27.10 gnl/TRDRNA2_/TRDRNA2_174462_c0_seq1:79-903(-)